MSPNPASVPTVLNHAIEVGAERVCFHDNTFTFAEPTLESIGVAMASVPSGRYKLQCRREGKWTDVSKYMPIFNAVKLLADLTTADFSGPINLGPGDIARAAGSRPEHFHAMLRRVFYATVSYQSKNPSARNLAAVSAYFERFADELTMDEHYNYFRAYLLLLRHAYAQGLPEAVESRKSAIVFGSLSELLPDIPACKTTGGIAAGDCLLGQILSLDNREAASRRFATLRAGAGAELVRFFYWDNGASTYYGLFINRAVGAYPFHQHGGANG